MLNKSEVIEVLVKVVLAIYFIPFLITMAHFHVRCLNECEKHVPYLEDSVWVVGAVWPLYWYDHFNNDGDLFSVTSEPELKENTAELSDK